MKRITHRHWTYLPAGVVLSAILIAFWYLNQDYMSPDRPAGAFLENPLPAFGLMVFGAFVASSIAGEFGIRAPLTIEPLIFSFVGGGIAGAGSVVAGMSVNSVVLFNLVGVFTLPAFMVTKGWLYIAFMVAGGAVGSRLLVLATQNLAPAKRQISVPATLNSRRSRLIYLCLGCLSVGGLAAAFIIASPSERRGAVVLSLLLMVLLGFAAERSTLCMSSMLKELFMSHSAYVWRNVLFGIMCLALLYRLGLLFGLYAPIETDAYVNAPVLLAAGSFVMGTGFVFADGCFIGTLWKTGQGNVINMAGLFGLVVGIGAVQMLGEFISLPASGSSIPNHLASLADSWLLVAVLWALGLCTLFLFRRKRYRY